MSEHDHEEVERLSPDPFALTRRIKQRLRESTDFKPAHTIKYLWLYVSKDGVHIPGEAEGRPAPSLEQWLALVDEAAALGVERMVVTALSDLSDLPDVWEICHWAQDGHDITVGIHVLCKELTPQTIEKMKELNQDKFRLFVPEDCVENYAPLEQEGIKVRPAAPAPVDANGGATGAATPHAVLFANAAGQLYLAGSGEGAQPSHMGNIYEDLLAKLLKEPKPSAKGAGGIPTLAGFPLKD